MKALMVLDREFPPDLRVENEIETLAGNGVEVHLACFTRKQKPALEKSDQLIIHRKPISSFHYKSSVAALTFPFYFRFWRKFLEELGSETDFDVVHVHDLPLVQVALDFARKRGIPVVADLHENWPAYLRIARHTQTLAGKILSPNAKWEEYEKNVLQQTDHIIVVVEEARKRLTELGIHPQTIAVVSNTINLAHADIPEKSGENDPPVLFYAGGIHYHRGLQTVIRAIAQTKQKKYRLIVLGEGSYMNDLIRLSESLGLHDQVSFPGWKTYNEMLQVMGKADFALIPHIKSDHTDSTIPHKLFQYMYAGIPVIASDCIPLKRILQETDAGFIFPSEDEEKLAELLDNIDQGLIAQMGRNGKEWVRKKYNWGNDAEKLLSVYKLLS